MTPRMAETRSDDRYQHRKAVLDEAMRAVLFERNVAYGPPTQDFDRVAGMLNALGFRVYDGRVQPHHVAIMLLALKLSRAMWSPMHLDSWADAAGYAACGYECAVHHADSGALAAGEPKEKRCG